MRIACALFLGCMAVYLANGRPLLEVDCVTPPYTAWALASHGTFDLSRDVADLRECPATEIREVRGQRIAFRPPGAALTAFPIVAPLTLVNETPPDWLTMMQLGKVTAAGCVATSAVVFFFLVRRWTPQAAWPAVLLYACGTSLWSVASQGLWPHGPAVLWTCVGLSLLLPGPGRMPGTSRAALAGLALGLAVLSRPTAVFFFGASGLALLLSGRWRATLAFTLAGAIPICSLAAFQFHYFADPVNGGYSNAGWDDRAPLWLGMVGLLMSPSRGLFVYTPALVFLVFAYRPLRQMERWERGLILCWLGAVAATVVCFAYWWCWWGGWCYGPRFFCESFPVLCFLVALVFAELSGHWARGLATGLIVISIGIHSLGVFGFRGYGAWHDRHCVGDPQGRAMFSTCDTQIEAHFHGFINYLRQPVLPED